MGRQSGEASEATEGRAYSVQPPGAGCAAADRASSRRGTIVDGAAIAAAERCLPRGHEGSAQRWLRWGGQLGVAAMLLPTLSQHIADHIEARVRNTYM